MKELKTSNETTGIYKVFFAEELQMSLFVEKTLILLFYDIVV